MQPALRSTLFLLLLPLTAAAATSNPTLTEKREAPNPAAARGFTDKVSAFFGDPAGMVNSLSDCMASCARDAILKTTCDDDLTSSNNSTNTNTNTSGGGNSTNTSSISACLCKKQDGTDEASGKAWEDQTKKCLDESMVFGCQAGDYDEGRLLEICKAVEEKPDKRNETDQAILDKFDLEEDDDDDGKGEGNGENNKQGGGNTTTSAAAAATAGPGYTARVAGGLLAAVVAYAVAML